MATFTKSFVFAKHSLFQKENVFLQRQKLIIVRQQKLIIAKQQKLIIAKPNMAALESIQ